MKSAIFGLSLAAGAAAQIVNGVSMVSMAASTTAAYAAATDYAAASSASSYYGSSAPPAYTAAGSSVEYAPPSQYTTPPLYTVTSMDYASFTAGGYSSMNCGYGYSKASDGSCQSETWVRG